MTEKPSFFGGSGDICQDEEYIRELINSRRGQQTSSKTVKKEDPMPILKLKMDDIEQSIIHLYRDFPNSSEKIKVFIDKIKEKYGSNDKHEAAEDNDEPDEKVY